VPPPTIFQQFSNKYAIISFFNEGVEVGIFIGDLNIVCFIDEMNEFFPYNLKFAVFLFYLLLYSICRVTQFYLFEGFTLLFHILYSL
jgi:hypothetical protein